MFDLAFLAALRAAELERIVRWFKPGSKVLEIGGGTGQQAKLLAGLGYQVVSVDIPGSLYEKGREFPIVLFDGERLPFGDSEFDMVYSSNVLEHVENLPALLGEMGRVLRPGGYGIHAMPTTAWRLWTSGAHYLDFAQQVAGVLSSLFGGRVPLRRSLGLLAGLLKARLWPARHGVRGNVFSELHYFSGNWWERYFEAHGFEVLDSKPLGLFYTGYMIFGSALPLSVRRLLAKGLGSAARVYWVRPHPSRQGERA